MKMKLIIGGIGLVLVLISVGVTLFLTGALGGGDEAAAAGGEPEVPEVPLANKYDTAEYYTFSPELLGNFPGRKKPRHIQIQMSVSTYDPLVIPAMEKHMPVLRDRLNTLINSQERESLSTTEGKEALRLAVLETIQEVLIERFGNKGVDEVFFNTFVME